MVRLGEGLPQRLCWDCGMLIKHSQKYVMELFRSEDGAKFRPRHSECPKKEVSRADAGGESGTGGPP